MTPISSATVKPKNPINALLISSPWQQEMMPCLGICVLAAYGRRHGFNVNTFHACQTFHKILSPLSEDILRPSEGEAIAASILFPDQQKRILRNMRRRYSGITQLRRLILDAFRNIFKSVQWHNYSLIGFSITHGKLYFSLLMARWLKDLKQNDTHITFGGPRVYGELGLTLLREFNQIDSLVCGEGENAFIGLLNTLSHGNKSKISTISGIYTRSSSMRVTNSGQQIENLDELPTPYFEEYVSTIKKTSKVKQAARWLSLEASRGCYNRCAFCTDVIGWKGYRTKSPEKVAKEIKQLVDQYRINNFQFADAVTPTAVWWKSFAKLMKRHKRRLRIHAEARSTVSRKHFIHMIESGVVQVQFGCETLASNILKMMSKNTRVIDNLHAMKLAEEFHINTGNNFMIRFPTERKKDIKECVHNIYYAVAYRPFEEPHNFVLEYGSCVINNPDSFGISNIKPHDMNCEYAAIPSFLLARYGSISFSFKKRHYINYGPLMYAYRDWYVNYFNSLNKKQCLLSYRNMGTHGVVIDRRRSKRLLRLNYVQNRIIGFCIEIRTWEQICRHLRGIDYDLLHKELADLLEQRILYKEDSFYLALPIKT